MNAIENLATKIQSLPAQSRWLSAQQDIIMGAGKVPRRGKGGVWADRIVRTTGAIGLDRPIVAVVTLTLLLALFCKQFGVAVTGKPRSALFVGIKALREPPLAEEFERLCERPASHADERDLRTFFALQRVTLGACLVEWFRVWREVWPKLGRKRTEAALAASLQLSFMLRIGHKYIYLRAWFRKFIRQRNATLPIGFSAASYTATAAIAVGGSAIYFQHGFQRRSIVYPDFAEFRCFNRYEAEHLHTRLPRCKITVRPEPLNLIETDRVLAVAGTYGELGTHQLCRSALEWALNRKLPVVVRPHPADQTEYWKEWSGVPGVRIMDEACDFDTFLLKVRPRFLLTWYSTAIFDALKRGSVPLTVCNDPTGDVVFPFERVALRWPKERATVEGLVDDPQACVKLIRTKYHDATDKTALIS